MAIVQSFSRGGALATTLLGMLWPIALPAAIIGGLHEIGPSMLPASLFFTVATAGLILAAAALLLPLMDREVHMMEGRNAYIACMQGFLCAAAAFVGGLFIGSQYRDWYGQFEQLSPAGIFGAVITVLAAMGYLAGAMAVTDRTREVERMRWVYTAVLLVQGFGAMLVGFHRGATMIL